MEIIKMSSVHLRIVSVIIIIIILQITWHFLICLHYSFPTSLLSSYLDHDRHSGKGISGFFDFTIPEAVLGYLLGTFGCRLSARIFFLYIILSGLILAYLMVFYVKILSWDQIDVWWWPLDEHEIKRRLVILFFEAELVLLFFSIAGRQNALSHTYVKGVTG